MVFQKCEYKYFADCVNRNEQNAWINDKIFSKWFQTIFLSEIKRCQMQHDNRNKMILLADNANSHLIYNAPNLNEKGQFIFYVSYLKFLLYFWIEELYNVSYETIERIFFLILENEKM
jgi:hypothetical protein